MTAIFAAAMVLEILAAALAAYIAVNVVGEKHVGPPLTAFVVAVGFIGTWALAVAMFGAWVGAR